MTSSNENDAAVTPQSRATSGAPEVVDQDALAARDKIIGAAEGALGRYRVMAYVTGVMLLLLVVEMILVYLVGIDSDARRFIAWIPIAHGWIYVVYVLTVVDLWTKMRWRLGRLVMMVLGGVIPAMSFVVEKKVHREALDRIAAAREV
jgi:integral membrane protein